MRLCVNSWHHKNKCIHTYIKVKQNPQSCKIELALVLWGREQQMLFFFQSTEIDDLKVQFVPKCLYPVVILTLQLITVPSKKGVWKEGKQEKFT
jgi:hypothetical protein